MEILAILAIIAVVCLWAFDNNRDKIPFGYEDKDGYHNKPPRSR